MDGVRLSTLIEKMGLKNMTESINTREIILTHPDINRPALQLTGYYNHFEKRRVQIIGNVEQNYLHTMMTHEQRVECYEKLFSQKIPCLILCRGYMPTKTMADIAVKYGVPLLVSNKATSEIMAEIIRFLNYHLAPMISIHGVLVDVYGEGVLIKGESGIGKSEIALELIKRGHRLVSDDVVEIKKISDDELIGSAPEITRYFIELRGIGIIDAKTLFGVGSVKDNQTIDMEIFLEKWKQDTEFDRMGTKDNYDTILGNQIPCYKIPVSPGRNVAIIIESAAINHRQKMMGYNAAVELYNRVTNRMMRQNDGETEGII
ncbi:MAG: HPr(Ser) kinase/phosphatase [Lachnospiraceae bacterium]|nr:HPr(Ser) kinase/phosphatase [Lachnospiraceae bacterium]